MFTLRKDIVIRYFIIIITIFNLIAPSNLIGHTQDKVVFHDVSKNTWYTNAIYELAYLGVISGVGNNYYLPNKAVTRAEAAAYISKAFNLTINDDSGMTFPDVSENKWYYPYILAVSEHGYMIGDGNFFNPDDSITRSQVVTILLRTLNIKSSEVAQSPFSDIHNHFFEKEINTGYEIGLTNGKSKTTFDPNGLVTRAEFAVFLFKESIFTQILDKQNSGGNKDLVINSIEASTTEVSHQQSGQRLQFSVNGQNMSINELESAGFNVEFLSDKDIFVHIEGTKSWDGFLSPTKLKSIYEKPISERKFKYRVILKKDDDFYMSEIQEVTILNYNKTAQDITSFDIKRGFITDPDITIRSQVLVTNEKYFITNIKGKLKNGLVVHQLRNYVESIEYHTSNPSVAIVNYNGEITPISQGTVTITVKSGDAIHSIELYVKSQKRVATTLIPTTEHMKISSVDSSGSERVAKLAFTLYDQYGDPFYNANLYNLFRIPEVIIKENHSSSSSVYVSFNQTNTTIDGKFTLNIQPIYNSSGEGYINIYFAKNSQLAGSIKLTVSRYTSPSKWEFTQIHGSDYTLDRHIENSLTFRLRTFNDNDIYLGDHIFNDDIFIESSDTDLVKVNINYQDIDIHLGTDETKTGQAKVTAYKGSLPIAEITINVIDSKPTIHNIKINDLEISNIHNGPLILENEIIQTLLFNTGTPERYELVNEDTVYVHDQYGVALKVKIISNIRDKNKVNNPAIFSVNNENEIVIKNSKTEDGLFQEGDTGEIYLIFYELRNNEAVFFKTIKVNVV